MRPCSANACDRPVAGTPLLCRPCRTRLARDLARLPGLYGECERLLGGSDRPRDRTSGGPMPGLPFNAAAAELRARIRAVLSSWAGLVVAERQVGAPARTPGALAPFLARHLGWLAAHPGAGELRAEIAELVRSAVRVVDPDSPRRVPIGPCVEDGCGGRLSALVRPSRLPAPAEIRCDRDEGHVWPAHEWTRLGRRMGEAARWLTAAEVSRLWSIPAGSVYRLAGEHGWARRKVSGRAYYRESDVTRTFQARARN